MMRNIYNAQYTNLSFVKHRLFPYTSDKKTSAVRSVRSRDDISLHFLLSFQFSIDQSQINRKNNDFFFKFRNVMITN
jgi:methionine salvage enolase-phosphatase E1